MLTVGDEFTIAGVCARGRIDLHAPPGALQLWRVTRLTPTHIQVEPMRAPGVVDEWAAAYGAYSIAPTDAVDLRS